MMSKRPTIRRLGATATALGLATVNVAVLVTGWTQGWITLWWVALTALCVWLAAEACSVLFVPDDPRPFAAQNALGARRWWTRGTEEYDFLAWGFTAIVCLACAYGVYTTSLDGWRGAVALLLLGVLGLCGAAALLCLLVQWWEVRRERRRDWAGVPPVASLSRTERSSENRSSSDRSSSDRSSSDRSSSARARRNVPGVPPFPTSGLVSDPRPAWEPAGSWEAQPREGRPREAGVPVAESSWGAPPREPVMEDTVVVTPLLRARPPAPPKPTAEETDALAHVAHDANPSPSMETLHQAFPLVSGPPTVPMTVPDASAARSSHDASATRSSHDASATRSSLDGSAARSSHDASATRSSSRHAQRPAQRVAKPGRHGGPVVDLTARRGRRG